MTFEQYLSRYRVTSREFAGKAKISVHAVRKWRQGYSIPRAAMVDKIRKLTKNKVKPADWY